MRRMFNNVPTRAGEVEMKPKRALGAALLSGLAPLAAAAILAVSSGGAALAAGGEVEVRDYDWSFEGPFGTFDEAQLQRGWQVYSEVCATCHSMRYLHYRDLGNSPGPNYPEAQVEAMAARFLVADIGDDGSEIERPALPTDPFVSPYANDRQAAAVNGGAIPPDLSLIVRARAGYSGIITQMLEGGGGAEYVYSVLVGYRETPPNFDVPQGGHYNAYFPGHVIKMPPPLETADITYQDGTQATIDQMARDVTAFLAWAADPHMQERKQAGLSNLAFLTIFAVLLWFSTKKLWKPVKRGEEL